MRPLPIIACSTLAIAAALLAAGSAQAQSFQGNVTSSNGASVTTAPGRTTVEVLKPQAVVNWAPDEAGSGPILFQPAGTTALFTTGQGSSLTDFAVLNRILPSGNRPIQLNGRIISSLQGSLENYAGSVYFYSPGGIIVGPSAVIDVGSLGLTTADPLARGAGEWLSDGEGGRTVTFHQSRGGTSIVTAPGSQITAHGSGSYVAMVAPRIEHGGNIRTGGSAALIAAEGATVTFRPSGLFDVQFDVGTTDSNGIVNSGAISFGAGDGGHRIYLAAMPKNTALTMLIAAGSELGFGIAEGARRDGDAVVLSAGRNIASGEMGSAGRHTARLGIGDVDVGTNLFAGSTGDFRAGDLAVEGNASLVSGERMFLKDVAARDLFVDSALSLTADGDVTADVADVRSGGLLRVHGLWNADEIQLASNRIDIDAPGALRATGLLRLVSLNKLQTTIGEEFPFDEYNIDQEEFSRLSGGSIEIVASPSASLAPTFRIGTLTVRGDQLGADGTLAFIVPQGEGGGGTMRITGNVVGQDFGAGQGMVFDGGLVELDAANASVSLTSGQALSGHIIFRADRVHVASAGLLDKLAADPNYAGRNAELNAPAAVQRPEGVLRAARITAVDPQAVLVQNTGTADAPAGILTGDANLIGTASGARLSAADFGGLIDLLISMQIVRDGATLSGPEVWNAFTKDPSFSAARYAPDSSLNGCLLTAAFCGTPPPEPEPREDIRQEISERRPLPDKLLPDDREKCSAGGGAEGTIGAPEKLVDSCPSDPDSPVDEPVSGSGNPALTEDAGGER